MPRRYTMLAKTDPRTNENKFYEVTLQDDNTVLRRWGRVGAEGQRQIKGEGDAGFDQAVKAKVRDHYRPVDIVVQAETAPHEPQSSLRDIAKRDLGAQDPIVAALVEKLVAINRHQLMAVSGGQIRIVDGQVRTPVGLVTAQSVAKARQLLVDLERRVERGKLDSTYQDVLASYLMQVPQKLPARRGWDETFFTQFTSFPRQNDLLDQLESSIALAAQTPAPSNPNSSPADVKRLFAYQIALSQDRQLFKKIETFYRSTCRAQHASSRLSLKRIYTVAQPQADQAFDQLSEKMGNVQSLWHGTRAHNILSIFKKGLVVPKFDQSLGMAGRLFGDGLYFSDQSSKSLNYSYGYWDHGHAENNCFMFLCDVAMGKVYEPRCTGDARRPNYDSCLARPGIALRNGALMNNEMIVYRIEQTKLRYLCEFDI
jgi:poly [ADP-ribose] polymerase